MVSNYEIENGGDGVLELQRLGGQEWIDEMPESARLSSSRSDLWMYWGVRCVDRR
jgi:hypothetical protein